MENAGTLGPAWLQHPNARRIIGNTTHGARGGEVLEALGKISPAKKTLRVLVVFRGPSFSERIRINCEFRSVKRLAFARVAAFRHPGDRFIQKPLLIGVILSPSGHLHAPFLVILLEEIIAYSFHEYNRFFKDDLSLFHGERFDDLVMRCLAPIVWMGR